MLMSLSPSKSKFSRSGLTIVAPRGVAKLNTSPKVTIFSPSVPYSFILY